MLTLALFPLLLLQLCLPTAVSATTALTITALPDQELIRLDWPAQAGIHAWHLHRDSDPFFTPGPSTFHRTTTDTLFFDSLRTVPVFYRVEPAVEAYSLSAVRRDLLLDRRGANRELFSQVQVVADSTGVGLLTTLADDRQGSVPQPATLCWRSGALAAFDASDSLRLNMTLDLPRRDPVTGLDNGRLGPRGGWEGFCYNSFAIAGGWSPREEDSLLILEKETLQGGQPAALKLVIDCASNTLRGSEIHRPERSLITRYHYQNSGEPLLLKRREQFSFRSDTLLRIQITDYDDYDLAAPPLAIDPLTLPPTPQPHPPLCPTPPPPDDYDDWSPCSALAAMENMNADPREATLDCANCHDMTPPDGFLLLHGFNSNPSTFNLVQSWLEENYDAVIFRPHFPTDFRASQMRDSLESRLERLGTIDWYGIGHSLGGLVGRDLLQNCDGRQPLRGLITIGSAHNGVALAANTQTARGLFEDLRDDIEDLLDLDLIDLLLGTNLSETFATMEVYFDQLESCASIVDLPPQSDYIQQLQSGRVTEPYVSLGCYADYHHPIAELYAGLTVQFSPPYPFGYLDTQRRAARQEFIALWEQLVAVTWTFRFIDQVNDIHWDLVTMNQDWVQYVLEAEVEHQHPLYEYHEDGDCFFCPNPPFCGREWCCHEQPQEPDGARFWCCWNCGGDVIVCYLGDVTTTIEVPHEGVITLPEQTWHADGDSSLVCVEGVNHFAELKSDSALAAFAATLAGWGWD